MPDSYVTRATIVNGKIQLSVQVDDFQPGDYVEISGQATQTGGAFANFYDIQPVPAVPSIDPSDPSDPEKHLYIYVTAAPVPHKFSPGEDITTMVRASLVWLTVLGKPTSSKPGETLPGLAGEGTTWGKPTRVAELTAGSWIDH